MASKSGNPDVDYMSPSFFLLKKYVREKKAYMDIIRRDANASLMTGMIDESQNMLDGLEEVIGQFEVSIKTASRKIEDKIKSIQKHREALNIMKSNGVILDRAFILNPQLNHQQKQQQQQQPVPHVNSSQESLNSITKNHTVNNHVVNSNNHHHIQHQQPNHAQKYMVTNHGVHLQICTPSASPVKNMTSQKIQTEIPSVSRVVQTSPPKSHLPIHPQATSTTRPVAHLVHPNRTAVTSSAPSSLPSSASCSNNRSNNINQLQRKVGAVSPSIPYNSSPTPQTTESRTVPSLRFASSSARLNLGGPNIPSPTPQKSVQKVLPVISQQRPVVPSLKRDLLPPPEPSPSPSVSAASTSSSVSSSKASGSVSVDSSEEPRTKILKPNPTINIIKCPFCTTSKYYHLKSSLMRHLKDDHPGHVQQYESIHSLTPASIFADNSEYNVSLKHMTIKSPLF